MDDFEFVWNACMQAPINGPNLQDEELMREIQGHDVIHVAVPELNNVEGGVVAALGVQASLVVPDNNNIDRLVPLQDEVISIIGTCGTCFMMSVPVFL